MFDRRNQERNRYSEGNMAVNYAELPSRTISEAFSFNDGETTLGVQFKPNIVPIKPNVDYHQYLKVMNDNKCSTRLYFGLTMEEDHRPTTLEAKVSNSFLANSEKKATGFN